MRIRKCECGFTFIFGKVDGKHCVYGPIVWGEAGRLMARKKYVSTYECWKYFARQDEKEKETLS